MSRTLFLAVLMAVIGIAYVAHGVAFRETDAWAPAGPVEPPVGIEVVRTWGDLLAQPAVDLPGGERVHVGIERQRIPLRSGALIYVLVEPHPDAFWPGGIGPLSMGMTRGNLMLPPSFAEVAIAGRTPPTDTFRLYVRPISLPAEGSAQLSLWFADVDATRSVMVATEELVADGTDPAPWLAVDVPDTQEAPSADAPFDVALAFEGGPWAIPDYDGHQAIAFARPGDRGVRNRPLPRLIPDGPAGTLRLSATEGGFTLESELDFVHTWPEDHLLVRFFRDGQPVPWAEEPRRVEMARSGSTRLGRRLRVEFDWNFELLDVRSGDAVEFEVMWCPAGKTDPTWFETARMQAEFPRAPRRSNRVTLTVP